MKGDQGRGAGGIDRHAGPMEIEHKGNTIGGNAGGVSSQSRRITGREILNQPVGIVRAGNPDEHARIAATYGGWPDGPIFQGLPTHLQQKPLLGVHLRGLTRGDAEELSVEAGNIP
ncbi:MAG: hypothetical protein JW395_1338 [Nitrospira sp.]|nr:hypothetical protein [Nitrospira sp.]